MHHPIHDLKKQWKFVILLSLICALIAGLSSLFFPLEYRADAQVLIISKTRFGVDPYTVVKSSERVGENIVQVMKTSDFYEKVFSLDEYSLDNSSYVDVTEKIKRKRWIQAMQPSVVYGTGVLNISTFSTDKTEAAKLGAASARALELFGWEYVGGDVTFKTVNLPVVTNYPARPNVLFNALLGFFVGGILISLLIVWRRS